jgi:serine O-acetyltransferase
MTLEVNNGGPCKEELAASHQHRESIPAAVERLVGSCNNGQCVDHIGPEPLPSRDAIIALVERTRRILYPGYFDRTCVDSVNVAYYFGQEVTGLFESLSREITLAVRHDCIRYQQSCSHCEERGQKEAVAFLNALVPLRESLALDVRAAYAGDPAAKDYDEIIFSYPGLFAVTAYRIAHRLFLQGVPLIPRIISEYAHGLTGIDIHPGAEIGESFFIDHGTGVVIGETATIGNRVRLYQGVTLGALSLKREEVGLLRNRKRHPTIEDDVIIYANATVLGGQTVIGARSIIGGNVWLTDSVPPDTEVFLKKPDLIYRNTSA